VYQRVVTGGGRIHSPTETRHGQAVHDVGGGRVLDQGTRDSGDGTY